MLHRDNSLEYPQNRIWSSYMEFKPLNMYFISGTTNMEKRNMCDKRQFLVYVNLDKQVDKPCTGNAEYQSIRRTSILYSAIKLIAHVSLPRISSPILYRALSCVFFINTL